MKKRPEEQIKARELRRIGYSLDEISSKLKVAKSSVSVWVRDIELSDKAKKRLVGKIKLGQIVSAENKKRKIRETLDKYKAEALKEINVSDLDKFSARLICSLIYYCEGNKNVYNGVGFTNSDPNLVKTFLFLLRKGFDINESKFHPCVHLHGYHNIKKQINFWAKTTNIPKSQFNRPYLKPNTGKRLRENYQGCINIRYNNNDMARQLLMTAKAFIEKYGGVV